MFISLTRLFDAEFCTSFGIDVLPLPSCVLSWLSLILGSLGYLPSSFGGVPVGFRLLMNSMIFICSRRGVSAPVS